MIREDGTYPTVPLRQNRITVPVVQTEVHGVPGDISRCDHVLL